MLGPPGLDYMLPRFRTEIHSFTVEPFKSYSCEHQDHCARVDLVVGRFFHAFDTQSWSTKSDDSNVSCFMFTDPLFTVIYSRQRKLLITRHRHFCIDFVP